MSPERRTLLALGECESRVAAGANVLDVLESAASAYQVPQGELALLILAKVIACSRARAERDAVEQADAETDPDAHTHELEDQC